MRLVLLSFLILTACATQEASVAPGQYRNYHDLSMATVRERIDANAAPADVKDRFARCYSAWFGQFIRSDNRARLDAYARGERSITEDEAQQILADTVAHLPFQKDMTPETVGMLEDLCPNDVPAFKLYGLPSS